MQIIVQAPDKQYHIIQGVQTGITLEDFLKNHGLQFLKDYKDYDLRNYTFHRGKEHIMDLGRILYNNNEITIKLHPNCAGQKT